MSSLFGKLLTTPRRGGAFTRGSWYTLILTTRCNLDCSAYCPMYVEKDGVFQERVRKYDECTAEEWIEFFDAYYPEWISYVCVSGGEPSYHKGLHQIVNHLTDRGTHVRLYTNLANVSEILRIKPSKRFDIWATFHHSDNKDIFVRHVQDCRLEHLKVQVNEIEEPMQLPESIHKGKYTHVDIANFNTLHFAPDTPRTKNLFVGCTPVYARGGYLNDATGKE